MKNKLSTKKIVFLFFVIIFAVVAGLYFFKLKDSKELSPTASSYTKGEVSPKPQNEPGDTTQAAQGSQKNASGDSAKNYTLIPPSGNFVSNHRPNLSGSPAPSQISSVCSSTPGAICTIEFTKDSSTKYLKQNVIDQGGSAYWSWNLKDVGLTEGTWTIKAIVRLGNEEKTAYDPLELVVAQ